MLQKAQVVEAIADSTELPKTTVSRVLDGLWETVEKSLQEEDGGVQLTGYVTISAVTRRARNARNPKTGAIVKLPTRRAVRVKLGTKLKKMV